MGKVYQYPEYYEIAFSWRDLAAEVKVFEETIRRYSGIPVKSMLEICCGPAPHLHEIIRRGYTYTGLDLSPDMLSCACNRAKAFQKTATFLKADMKHFDLSEPVDFAFLLLGSFFIQNTADLFSHFEAMSQALKPGGLYFLDWCINFAPNTGHHDAWTIERDGISVTTDYAAHIFSAVEQTVEETITLTAMDNGKQTTLTEKTIRREVYPQEFLLVLEKQQLFEFIGWWNNWDLAQPLNGTQDIQRPITVIRRI